jgi:hypothetical protein
MSISPRCDGNATSASQPESIYLTSRIGILSTRLVEGSFLHSDTNVKLKNTTTTN